MILTDFNKARIRADVVMLADGRPFLIGGGQGDPTHPGGLGQGQRYGCPLYIPEIFDPATETWTALGQDPHWYARMYHSVTIVLRDGSVWIAGQHEEPYCGPNRLPDQENGLVAEIYKPWYFDHARPIITSSPTPLPENAVEHEAAFEVEYTHTSTGAPANRPGSTVSLCARSTPSRTR